MSIFKGAGVAIVTPMKSDLEVNYDKLAELLEEQIAGKTDSIVICGTTGEGMSQIACMVARLHNSFLGTAIIVTILLLNIILEVKILKFF